MDFVEGLLKSNGFDTIFVMVDRLSNFAHFVTLKHLLIAKIVADVFIREVVPLDGFPLSTISDSDRDEVFIHHFWSELFHSQGTPL